MSRTAVRVSRRTDKTANLGVIIMGTPLLVSFPAGWQASETPRFSRNMGRKAENPAAFRDFRLSRERVRSTPQAPKLLPQGLDRVNNRIVSPTLAIGSLLICGRELAEHVLSSSAIAADSSLPSQARGVSEDVDCGQPVPRCLRVPPKGAGRDFRTAPSAWPEIAQEPHKSDAHRAIAKKIITSTCSQASEEASWFQVVSTLSIDVVTAAAM